MENLNKLLKDVNNSKVNGVKLMDIAAVNDVTDVNNTTANGILEHVESTAVNGVKYVENTEVNADIKNGFINGEVIFVDYLIILCSL